MQFQIIILAGGKGTRIKPLLGDKPKILAPINKEPFIKWLILWINSWGIKINNQIILATCIGHEEIESYCQKNNLPIRCISEKKPLGTFGAVANVISSTYSENYIILNGDSIFKADIKNIALKFFHNKKEQPLIILKNNITKDTRYGGYVETDGGWIYSKDYSNYISLGMFFISYNNFKKRWIKSTSTNLDSYLINNNNFKELMIDKDCFGEEPIKAEILNKQTPFIDIGIPNDYFLAQSYIPKIIKNLNI